MLDSIQKQGCCISSCSEIDFWGHFLCVKIQQISSMTFLWPDAWVAMVTGITAIGQLESAYFYIGIFFF